MGDILNVNNDALYITGFDENRNLVSVFIAKKDILNIRRTRLKAEVGMGLDKYITEEIGKRELVVTYFVRMVTNSLKLYSNQKMAVGDLFFTIEILTNVGVVHYKFNFTDEPITNMMQIKREMKTNGVKISSSTIERLEEYFKVLTIRKVP